VSFSSMLSSACRTPVLCVVAAVAGVGSGSEANAQIVPVSRLGTITRTLNHTATPPTTYTAWESGIVGDDHSTQALTLGPGSITASCSATGLSVPSGTPSVLGESTVALTFDILALSAFTLTGTGDWFVGHGSVVLSREGGPSLFSYNTLPAWHGPATFGTSGSLVPGRYVLSISVLGPDTNPGSNITLSATLNVVPTPGSAALGLASAAAPLARRRRRA
jgi:hypothetical protein